METQENTNFLHLQKMLREIIKPLKVFFQKAFLEKYGEIWANSKSQSDLFLKNKSLKLNSSEKALLTKADSSNFDISLLCKLISIMKPNDYHAKKFINKIREVRNSIAHNVNMSIKNQDFNIYSDHLNDVAYCLTDSKKFFENLAEKSEENSEFVKLKNEGNSCFKSKKMSEAIQYYQNALQIPKLNDKNIAILHSNLANAYYELFLSSSNEIYLQESSFHAKTCVFLDPGFLKAYYRLALIYEHYHKLEKSLIFCNKGLAILPSSEDLINIKARVKNKLYDTKRHATLFSDSFPKTYEEHNEELRKEYEEKALNISVDELERQRKNMEKNDPTLIDVFNGHEYRDGSARYSQNYETAAMYYSKAAQKGNVEAMYNLGLLYFQGKGVQQSLALSFQFLERAAESHPRRKFGNLEEISTVGVAEAQQTLGHWYLSGIYVDQNVELGIKYYERSVENGSSGAANNLGIIYYEGIYVRQDFKKAEMYYLMAFSKGSQQARENLVELYLNLENPDTALLWHERGMESGCLFTQSRDSQIRTIIEDMRARFESTGVPKWEIENGYSKENLSFPERFDRFMEKTLKIKIEKDEKKIKEERFFENKIRKKIMIFFRENLNNCKLPSWRTPLLAKDKCIISFTFPAKEISERITNDLQKIYIKEIDNTRDYILKDKYLELTIIDHPMLPIAAGMSYQFLCQDENFDVERMAVYGLRDEKETLKRFNFGTKLTLLRPYMRQANDGKTMFRVDDPNDIVIVGYRKMNSCRLCGEENCSLKCKECNLAYYCSKECQIFDWKELKHKLVCFNKKYFD